MGLYLCVFDGEEEVEGVDVGRYSDFCNFRDTIQKHLEQKGAGSKYPVLMLHSDCDGEWRPDESKILEKELREIGDALKKMPPIQFMSDWQAQVAHEFGVNPKTLYDCFIDVDGIPLIDRLLDLSIISQKRNLPILFQ